VLEESPSPALDAKQRDAIGKTVCTAIRKLGYLGVGTIEFLYENGEFYFIEMNTRLQVEHPVTEMVTGVDLVREQIMIAAGEKMSFTQKDVHFEGHAIECRINAENPETFAPCPGLIADFHAPGGLGVRLDSAVYSGYRVPPTYDSLIGKLIVHAPTRHDALMRMKRAIGEMVVNGVETTLPLHMRLVENADIQAGDYDIHWLEHFLADNKIAPAPAAASKTTHKPRKA
jgi:acetyl-CoA carboxylase biotin carboxylase subunit